MLPREGPTDWQPPITKIRAIAAASRDPNNALNKKQKPSLELVIVNN
jgi:hypothetical protein